MAAGRDRLLVIVIEALLRVARRLSLLRPRRHGKPWPGLAHAHLATAIVALMAEADERRRRIA